MRKARVNKRRKYAFEGLTTRLCRAADVLEQSLDDMVPLFSVPVDITKTKEPDNEFGPTLTTMERHRRDELIMDRMYGMDMLHHQNGCRASTDVPLGDVKRRYPH
ncbi:hypothetical protein KY290_012937 [Solanum tuberosum]|uniref:Uncharacterized protein n=1 Tax=Solanum tuberosum TaxID=4113 RepID=A0ABQ7VKC4_SOLTU|nr:hypothetical protein KY285_012706 [Solanum tuberosum]KAH0768956.1 hypothetical protein KY290_012937 [Solanum tuberosum]